ncbi:putative metalloprotease [Scheffersomyces xylosifermentans]|uniref:putative metalloprotease n=1 Tax=Scheffersomyces xylosifermentans TaxID=1304137 RepID=UPI00315D9D94
MQLAVQQEDADILLKEKNVLDESVLDKYRVSGQIAQTALQYIISLINDSYHLSKQETPLTVQELCILGDSFLSKLLSRVYNNVIREKGIAQPTTIEVNELIAGFAPEIDDEGAYTFTAGDVVTVSLGAQIDGYTSTVAHTIVIYPAGVEINNEVKPNGPLLGSKADAICATHIATETVVALLGLALSPEKLPAQLKVNGSAAVTGGQIRAVVDSIADSFNCVVLPGSKVRRVRRFLAGQAEGIVAERDFKGTVWDESHQEQKLLQKSTISSSTDLITSENNTSNNNTGTSTQNSSAIPTDDFVILAGEVYQVDIRMASLGEFEEAGLITTDEVDHFTGKNNKDEFNCKSTIHIRDFAITHHLKLKTSRRLLGEVDKRFSVYPFKLAYTCRSFPIKLESDNLAEQIAQIKQELKTNKLGLSELANRHLINSKPIQVTKFIPLDKILLTANPTGNRGIDMTKPVLPGMEVPLPNLGVSSLMLRGLLKHGKPVANVRESSTVLINNVGNEVIRLTGGSKTSTPSWVHSQYKLAGPYVEAIEQIVQLSKDKRFGIKVKECQPYKLSQTVGQAAESMQLD